VFAVLPPPKGGRVGPIALPAEFQHWQGTLQAPAGAMDAGPLSREREQEMSEHVAMLARRREEQERLKQRAAREQEKTRQITHFFSAAAPAAAAAAAEPEGADARACADEGGGGGSPVRARA
jgi:hypothetical protein